MSDNELLMEITDVFPPIDIQLPTRGIFYRPGILKASTDPNHIEVRTLGVMDEFKYRDPFLLVSGKAITHLIRHLCGEQIILPEQMCEIDIETILLAARLASYGPSLNVTHSCIKTVKDKEDNDVVCDHSNTISVNLHEHILRYGPIQDEERFEVLLPRVGQTVYLKPVPYQTTIDMMRNVMTNRRRIGAIDISDADLVMRPEDFAQYEDVLNLSMDIQIKAILDCIWAVKTRSGTLVEDPMQIGPWIFELPKSDHDVITKRITEITEDLRKLSLLLYQCGACGQENAFHLQMNAEILFLADSGDSTVPATSSDMQPRNKGMSRKPSRISPRQRSLSQEPSTIETSPI